MNQPGEAPTPSSQNQEILSAGQTVPAYQPDSLRKRIYQFLWDLLLLGILILGAYFRFFGIGWDEGSHMHPDERFMTMVGSAISPVSSLAQYFNTNASSLNPNNVGYGFYVYGTLPLFIVRYTAEAVNQAGYGEIAMVGRALSGLFDLGTVLLVFLIAARLFRNERMALLAASLYSFSVLPIQLSHFFKEDTFLAFFTALTVYAAVRILPKPEQDGAGLPARPGGFELGNYLFFGLAFSMALASKISIAPLALLLPLAAFLRWFALPPQERERQAVRIMLYLVLAGLVGLLGFRIFQPYAFSGPGFFGLIPNPQWVENMKSIAAQNSGDVDFPPQLQWARRTPLFSLQNMVEWGLGLPLGILAWAGFLWMGWRIIRGNWQERTPLVLIWVWTGAYFAWQAASITRTMRYEMPVYPTLPVIAAWAVFTLWELGKRRFSWQRVAAVVLAVGVVAGTGAWAFAFTRIYTRTFTRVDASRWIYQNVPGPLNLQIEASSGLVNQPLSLGHSSELTQVHPLFYAFVPQETGKVTRIHFEHIVDVSSSAQDHAAVKPLVVMVAPTAAKDLPMAYALVSDSFPSDAEGRGKSYDAVFNAPVLVEAGKTYYFGLELGQAAVLKFSGPVLFSLNTGTETITQPLPEPEESIRAGELMGARFTAVESGSLNQVIINRIVDLEANPSAKKLRLIIRAGNDNQELAAAELNSSFLMGKDPRGDAFTVDLDRKVVLEKGQNYTIFLQFLEGPGRISIYGSKHVNETTWDDALPLGVDGYDPYGYSNGIYRTDLNFEMYWDDNPDKLDRFLNNLNQADYIFISSNRQYGTTVRVPERYPLTTLYYRSLIGCPPDKDILWCYYVAEPGMFQSRLGFELVKIDQNDPNLGVLRFNTQFAEEAFTVYDNPKVLIFKKTANYDPAKVRALFKTVDLTKVVHLTPNKAAGFKGDLMLSEAQRAIQQAGGTWSELFNREALQNKYPGLGLVLWYLAVSLLGWIVFPMVRLALRGLPDRGFPFARMVALLLLAYPTWLAGSYGIPFTPVTVSLVAAGLLVVNLILAWLQRRELARELRERWRYILAVELIGLAFFAVFVLVRLGNPDLWHPYKGGEKPMDFSYFNAVLKSTIFPPYDPWFAGGYINYYYYGFVIMGVPVKWLGIIPSIAYNLILPQLVSLLALGGFSVVWNILVSVKRAEKDLDSHPYGSGLMGAVFLVMMGNLGTLRMLWHGVMNLAAPGGSFETGNIFQRIAWTFLGIVNLFRGQLLPYHTGDWYWIPSRAIPDSAGSPITEFPAFTFLYADLHAHMIALPVTVLCLGWALSIVLGKWKWGDEEGRLGWLHFCASLGLGALAIGTLRPTNTWDFPTYLGLGVAALIYSAYRNANLDRWKTSLPGWLVRAGIGVVCAVVLAGLAVLLYQPYAQWYGQAYNSVAFWKDGRTPSWSYLTHWGLFLFMIVSYLYLETVDWMAKTPLSALRRFSEARGVLAFVALLPVVAIAIGLIYEVWIVWLVLPLMVWAAVLLLRPGMAEGKRALLFIIGTGLLLTLMVEVIVLVGDISRMNTVFKFYLQAWTLLGLSAAVGLAWSFDEMEFAQAKREGSLGSRSFWYIGAAGLIASAALFPLLAGQDKITDRMSPLAPHTLDGMAYMQTSSYAENNVDTNQPAPMDLSQDYRAIQWMQDHVSGSPVIVEGHVGEYRWGNRFTIYTGLPGVVGWNWHQRQQRALLPEVQVTSRIQQVDTFYNDPQVGQASVFLQKYAVRYIIVGQLERAVYFESGLIKFETYNGQLWDEVYRDKDTVIYQVR